MQTTNQCWHFQINKKNKNISWPHLQFLLGQPRRRPHRSSRTLPCWWDLMGGSADIPWQLHRQREVIRQFSFTCETNRNMFDSWMTNLVYLGLDLIHLTPKSQNDPQNCIISTYRIQVYWSFIIKIKATLNPKKTGLFWRLERLGGGGGGGISAVDRAIAAKICTMVVCDVIYKTVYLDFPK